MMNRETELMRKRNEPQGIGKQLALFERQGRTYRPIASSGETQEACIGEVSFRSELAQMQALTRGLLGEVMSLSNLTGTNIKETAVIRKYVRWYEGTEAGQAPLQLQV